MPEPPASVPANHAESWAGAKTMQAQLYYMNGDYEKVDSAVKATVDALKKFTGLEEKKRDDLAYTIRSLKYAALQGRAVEFIKAREFAKVGGTLGAELAAIKKELQAKAPEETPGLARMRSAQRDLLVTCMSAFVQNKQADQASELLDALQASGGSLEKNVANMRALNVTIEVQMSSLTKEGKRDEADDLAKSYSDFLDKIKGDDANLDKLPKGVIMFLGQGYGAVNQHEKGSALLGQLLAGTDATKELDFHRQLQFMQAHTLRQAGGKENFDKATALMQAIVGDPLKKGKRGWGYSNIKIRKEYIMLLEDQKFYGPAVSNWVRMTNEFVPGGLPVPIRFLGQRESFVAFAKVSDEALREVFHIPGRVSAIVDYGFKHVYPAVAEKRNQLRLIYFDLFVEAQRCSARAYSDPDIVAKLRGGQQTANEKLADIGQKLFDLLTKNDDVQTEVKENVQDLLQKHPLMKKKFDELLAAAPKS
jgi:hypothetical protein